jgi:hypothetical protein
MLLNVLTTANGALLIALFPGGARPSERTPRPPG